MEHLHFDQVLRILERFEHFPEIRREKCRTVFECAWHTKTGAIVELGSYVGYTAISLAYGAEREIHTIDKEQHKDLFPNLKQAEVLDDVKFHLGLGQDIAKTWTEPIGYLHFDLDENVMDCFHEWERHMMPNGIITIKYEGNDAPTFENWSNPNWKAFQHFGAARVYALRRKWENEQ